MAGYPAGLVLDSLINDDSDDLELRVAFDFDGVLADDSAEQVFQSDGLEAFHRSESEQADIPHGTGPLQELFVKIAKLQEIEVAPWSASTRGPSYLAEMAESAVGARRYELGEVLAVALAIPASAGPSHSVGVPRQGSESMNRGAVCGSLARTDLWEPEVGNHPGPPGDRPLT